MSRAGHRAGLPHRLHLDIGHPPQRAVVHRLGVVDQEVDSSPDLHGVLDAGLDLVSPFDVALHGHRLPGKLVDLGRDRLTFPQRAAEHGDPGALFGDCQGHASANTLACSRHDRYVAIQNTHGANLDTPTRVRPTKRAESDDLTASKFPGPADDTVK
jgi:hypothetical protein